MEIVKGEMIINSADILQYMEDFASARGWNLEEIGNQQFKAVLVAVGSRFFGERTGILYKGSSRYNGLDYDILLYIYNLYANICMLYNKTPSIMGYSYLLGINKSVLVMMIQRDKGGGASSQAVEIVKNLTEIREDSLLDRAIDKGGAVGVAIVGNYQYNWDKGGNVAESHRADSVALPCFSVNNTLEQK